MKVSEHMSSKDNLSAIAARYWQFLREEIPTMALSASQPLGGELLREAPEDYARREQRASEFLAELDQVDARGLEVQQFATWTLMREELELLREAYRVNAHLRPSLFPFGPDLLVAYVADGVALLSEQDALDWLNRLSSVANGLDGVVRSLQAGIDAGLRYPRLHLRNAVANVKSLLQGDASSSQLHGPFLRVAGRSSAIDALANRSLEIIQDKVLPAIAAYGEFIEGPLSAVARDSISCCDDADGRAFYDHLIRRFATVAASPEKIHALGLSEVERLDAEARQAASAAGFDGDVATFRRVMSDDPKQYAPSATALREEMEILSKRIEPKLPAFFGRLPRVTYGVQSIPDAASARMPPAYAQPSPADCSAPGIHWITSHPTKAPRFMHIPLALHEAWPGHLMHLALLHEQEHLPDFQRFGALGYTACLEGWALYCERLGEDMGLYDTPDKRFGRIEMEMWRAVRLVVDTGIHAKGWSRQEAMDFASARLALPLETLEAEIDRYISMPGQALAYQLGNIKFRELRERAEKTLGPNMRLRDFHDALMAAGPVSLPVLDVVIDHWITRQKHSGL